MYYISHEIKDASNMKDDTSISMSGIIIYFVKKKPWNYINSVCFLQNFKFHFYLLSNSLTVVLEKTCSKFHILFDSKWCFTSLMDSTKAFARCRFNIRFKPGVSRLFVPSNVSKQTEMRIAAKSLLLAFSPFSAK